MSCENSFDLVVIGGGPGGYVASIRAAQLGMRVACVDKSVFLGGTCLNEGCIPSKALLHSSEIYHELSTSANYGVEGRAPYLDFSKMQSYKDGIVSSLGQGIPFLLSKANVEKISGKAELISPNEVKVGDRILKSKNILLATGSEPIELPILPFDEKKILSSTGALSLKEVPSEMIVIGAGVIGVELASVYARLGSRVKIIEMEKTVCPFIDRDLSKGFKKSLESQGIEFVLGSKVTSAKVKDKVELLVEREGKSDSFYADVVLVAVGRKPNSNNSNLGGLGIELDPQKRVLVDANFRTNIPSVYAIGDLIDGPMLAHKASEEAVAAVEVMAGLKPHVNYMAIPNVIYTQPEIAYVGLTEEAALALGRKVFTGKFPFKANSRARCSNSDEGMVKIMGDELTGKILGLHIMSASASELIAIGVICIEKGITVKELARMPQAHPTLSEAIKEAALAALNRALHIP